MKVFISQPMNGKSEEEILAEREAIIAEVKRFYEKDGENVEILDTYFNDYEIAKCKNKPLAYIAKSIERLADADLAVFAKGWGQARGCIIEWVCATRYGIMVHEI